MIENDVVKIRATGRFGTIVEVWDDNNFEVEVVYLADDGQYSHSVLSQYKRSELELV